MKIKIHAYHENGDVSFVESVDWNGVVEYMKDRSHTFRGVTHFAVAHFGLVILQRETIENMQDPCNPWSRKKDNSVRLPATLDHNGYVVQTTWEQLHKDITERLLSSVLGVW